jgi:hypothetical protein
MSVGISNTDLIDLQRTTLQNLPDLEFEVALENQAYEVTNRWFKKDKKQVESGTSIQRNIMLDKTGNAKHVRLYQKTPINVADAQYLLSAPWVQVQTHYSIERREALRNRAPARYIDLLRSRRVDATVDLANLLELRAWLTPNNQNDDLNPRGVPYWINKAPTGVSQVGAFNGITIRFGDGSTSTVKAGLDGNASTSTKWRNWAFTYDAVNSDFVKRMRRAFHATKFQSPKSAKDIDRDEDQDFRIYMPLDPLTEFEDLVTKQNDNLGSDADKYHGTTRFRGCPIIYENQLDADVDAPVVALNHKKFVPFILEGDWMRESDPMMDVEQHNVMTTYIDGSYQFMCLNVREGGFIGHKVTAT